MTEASELSKEEVDEIHEMVSRAAAGLASRLIDAVRASDVVGYAAAKDTVETKAGEWHIAASYDPDDETARIQGRLHVAGETEESIHQLGPFTIVQGGSFPMREFTWVFPVAWLERLL